MKEYKMMNKDGNVVILKASGHTISHSLKSAILGNFKKNKTIYVDAIGVIPNYVTVKAIIMIRGILSTSGKGLEAIPYYNDIKLDKPTDGISIKTGIRWILKQKESETN